MGTLVNVNTPANTLAGVLVGPAALMPADWSLRRAYEGPQIIIEWGDAFEPASVLSQRLVRRRFGFPEDENDGVIVFDGPTGANKISDVDVEACICYFYKMFVFATNGDILISKATEGSIIPLVTGFFGPKMFELMPELYKLNDKGIDEAVSPKRALSEGAALGDVEVYNLGEDGTVLRGPLQRMFREFGPALDEGKGLIDCFPAQIDVDTSCLPELEGIAALLGLALNKELSPEKFRNEARVQVDNLKLKGTIPGLENRLRSVSGLDAIITEQCNLVLISNDPDRVSLKFDPVELCNINGPDDEVFRSVGFYEGITPFWLWFNVYMDIDLATFELTEPLARKWCIAIDESSPTCHRGFLFVRTGLESDTIPIGLLEEAEDIIVLNDNDNILIIIVEVIFDEQVAAPASWLIFNDVTKLTNTPDYTAVVATPTLP
jgi:hypothetical protein